MTTSSSRACNHNKNLSSDDGDDDDDDDDDTRAATFAACGLGSVRHTIAYQVGIIAAYYMYSVSLSGQKQRVKLMPNCQRRANRCSP